MSIGMGQLLLILVLFLVLFGAGKLPRVMEDLAKGLKAFKKGMGEDESPSHACQHVQIINKGGEEPEVSVSADQQRKTLDSATQPVQDQASPPASEAPTSSEGPVKKETAASSPKAEAEQDSSSSKTMSAKKTAASAKGPGKKIPPKKSTAARQEGPPETSKPKTSSPSKGGRVSKTRMKGEDV